MASSSSDPDRSDGKDQQMNPFVAFRRFADSQMSSLMNTVFGISESSPVRRQQAIEEYESMLKKAREINHDQPTSHSAIDPEVERAEHYKQKYRDSLSQIKAEHKATPLTRDERSLEDEELPYDDDDDDQYLLRGERGIERPRFDTKNPGLGDLVPRMPTFGITYLFTSPYSPLYLEQEEIFEEHSGKLRAAFADLLAYQKDQSLLSNNSVRSNAQMSQSDWLADMTGMIIFGKGERRYGWGTFNPLDYYRLISASEFCDQSQAQEYEEDPCPIHDYDIELWRRYDFCNLARRAFGLERGRESDEQIEEKQTGADSEVSHPLWQAIRDEFGKHQRDETLRQWAEEENEQQQATDSKTDEIPTSELDLYHALMDPQLERKDDQRAVFERRANIATKPSVLSTLTTTEQRTLPDGSVTTKVVLKKRFSDGVEELTENVHTQNAPLPQKSVNAESLKRQESASKKPRDENRSGWFWS